MMVIEDIMGKLRNTLWYLWRSLKDPHLDLGGSLNITDPSYRRRYENWVQMLAKRWVLQWMIFLKQKTISFSAPGPTTAVSYMSVKCVDVRKNHHKTKWLMPWGPNQCDKIRDIEEAIPREIEANDIVFSVHIPLPSMEMSPWFQFMLFILQLDIAFKLNNQIRKCPLLPFSPLDISLFRFFQSQF